MSRYPFNPPQEKNFTTEDSWMNEWMNECHMEKKGPIMHTHSSEWNISDLDLLLFSFLFLKLCSFLFCSIDWNVIIQSFYTKNQVVFLVANIEKKQCRLTLFCVILEACCCVITLQLMERFWRWKRHFKMCYAARLKVQYYKKVRFSCFFLL